MLDKDFVTEVPQAEIKGDVNLVAKANALKRRGEECAAEPKKLNCLNKKKKSSKINGILLQYIP